MINSPLLVVPHLCYSWSTGSSWATGVTKTRPLAWSVVLSNPQTAEQPQSEPRAERPAHPWMHSDDTERQTDEQMNTDRQIQMDARMDR